MITITQRHRLVAGGRWARPGRWVVRGRSMPAMDESRGESDRYRYQASRAQRSTRWRIRGVALQRHG
ncbi:MAG: hypothetical protein HOA26_08545 [Actinobacteria bacterium]|nr:hypothetical protein [Actinomycetota bacterium]MBT6649705.1 hypothetical protein [Actinomycetota bacterium]MBT6873274.1 hypothetical protein [Actinomycetota bacterium]MBT7662756.1 hypothetical protein [Actinomycetota bacterium]